MNKIEEAFKKYIQWSTDTFDTQAHESCDGLIREVKELKEYLLTHGLKQESYFELADVFMYAFYIAHKMKMDLTDIANVIELKLKVNKDRRWNKNSDGTFSHIKKHTSSFEELDENTRQV